MVGYQNILNSDLTCTNNIFGAPKYPPYIGVIDTVAHCYVIILPIDKNIIDSARVS